VVSGREMPKTASLWWRVLGGDGVWWVMGVGGVEVL
jgi:hypothetical protein